MKGELLDQKSDYQLFKNSLAKHVHKYTLDFSNFPDLDTKELQIQNVIYYHDSCMLML